MPFYNKLKETIYDIKQYVFKRQAKLKYAYIQKATDVKKTPT